MWGARAFLQGYYFLFIISEGEDVSTGVPPSIEIGTTSELAFVAKHIDDIIQRIVNIQKDSLNLFFIIKNPLKIIIITIIYSLLLNFVNRKTIFCQWTNITFWVTSKAYIPSMPYKNVINIFKVFWRNNFNKVLFDF